MPARRILTALLGCLALCAARPPKVSARDPRSHLRFEIRTVEPSTGRRKTSYAVGETVSVVFELTNRGREARKIRELQDTEIRVRLTWKYNRSDRVDSQEGVRGGTGGSYTSPGGGTVWTSRPALYTTIQAGQTLKIGIDDLARFFATHLDDGVYTLTADYPGGLRARCSFRVVIDEAVSVPVLERLLRDETGEHGSWAAAYLAQIRRPSISGRVAARGVGLKGVFILVRGTEKTNIETRSGGLYDLMGLTSGGTYTLTPSLEGYTFDPPSRTVTNLTTKLSGVNFTARRARLSFNLRPGVERQAAGPENVVGGPVPRRTRRRGSHAGRVVRNSTGG